MLKRVGIVVLQLLVTGAGIAFVFHDPQTRARIAEALSKADWRWLVAGWLTYGMVEVLATVRWELLLRVQGISLGWLRACGIVMLGLFCNLFLPGLIGGDAVRIYFLFRDAPQQKTRAALTVAMDRFLGLLSLIFLAALSVGLRYDWLRRSGVTLQIVWLAIALLGGAAGFVILLVLLARFDLLHHLPGRFPFRKVVGESVDALKIYAEHLRTMLMAFLTTLGSHLAYYVCFYCAGQSLHGAAHVAPSLVDVLTIMPLVNTVTGLPISLGGVGVRETLFQEMLGRLSHVPIEIAALTASLGFAMQASWGVLGAAAYPWLQKRPSPSPGPEAAGELRRD